MGMAKIPRLEDGLVYTMVRRTVVIREWIWKTKKKKKKARKKGGGSST